MYLIVINVIIKNCLLFYFLLMCFIILVYFLWWKGNKRFEKSNRFLRFEF